MEGLLGAGATGSILGILGSFGNKIIGIFQEQENRKTLKVQLEHERGMAEFQKDMHAQEHEAAIEIGEQDIDQSILKGSYEGLLASLNAEANLSSDGTVVGNIRTLVRPLLTAGLVTLTGVYYLTLAPEQSESAEFIINATVGMSTLAVSWWFGDRYRPLDFRREKGA